MSQSPKKNKRRTARRIGSATRTVGGGDELVHRLVHERGALQHLRRPAASNQAGARHDETQVRIKVTHAPRRQLNLDMGAYRDRGAARRVGREVQALHSTHPHVSPPTTTEIKRKGAEKQTVGSPGTEAWREPRAPSGWGHPCAHTTHTGSGWAQATVNGEAKQEQETQRKGEAAKSDRNLDSARARTSTSTSSRWGCRAR